MLPFLRKKPVAGLIISKRNPDNPAGEESNSVENEDADLEACAQDLISAVHNKDAAAAARAIRYAFECLESKPNEENYDDLNKLAAENNND